MMTLRNKIELIAVKDGYGHNAEQTEIKKTVWGNIGIPSTSLKFNAENVGIKADLIVHLWRKEFEKEKFTHIEIGGQRYRIASTGADVNELFVKLIVERC